MASRKPQLLQARALLRSISTATACPCTGLCMLMERIQNGIRNASLPSGISCCLQHSIVLPPRLAFHVWSACQARAHFCVAAVHSDSIISCHTKLLGAPLHSFASRRAELTSVQLSSETSRVASPGPRHSQIHGRSATSMRTVPWVCQVGRSSHGDCVWQNLLLLQSQCPPSC